MSKQSKTFQNVLVSLGKTTFLGELILKEKINEIPEVVVYSGKPVVDVGSTTTEINLLNLFHQYRQRG